MDTQELPAREITPPSYRLKFGKQSPSQKFSADFAKYMQDIAEFEEGSRQYVYDNPNAKQSDFRMHCFWLANLICDGTYLLEQLHGNKLAEEFPLQFQLINQKNDEFVARLYDWHGPAGSHQDEPESFKQAMTEVAKGDIHDFDL